MKSFMFVTEDGIDMLEISVWRKALFPMLNKPSDRTTSLRFGQRWNAVLSMVFMVPGIVMPEILQL